jgi:hypothetical protein
MKITSLKIGKRLGLGFAGILPFRYRIPISAYCDCRSSRIRQEIMEQSLVKERMLSGKRVGDVSTGKLPAAGTACPKIGNAAAVERMPRTAQPPATGDDWEEL